MFVAGVVFVAAFGLVVGSFLTMLIDRVPDKLAVLSPGPRCPYCEHRLSLLDSVPVLSWFALGGSCRHCDHKITVAYPAVEVVTSALFVAATIRFGFGLDLVVHWLVIATLVSVSVVDLYRYRIPNRILFPALGAAVPLVVVVSILQDTTSTIGPALFGAALYFLMLFVPHIVYPKGMGFGDVKLALLMGLAIGWVAGSYLDATRLVLVSLIVSSLLGVVGGGAVALARKVSGGEVLPDPDYPAVTETEAEGQVITVTQTSFPFGPALAAATLLAMLLTDQLLNL